MTEDEAREQVEKPVPENHLLIRISFDEYLVLPYKQGIKLMETLQHAEIYRTQYSSNSGIHPLNRNEHEDLLQTNVMPHKRYVEIKMHQLLKPQPA